MRRGEVRWGHPRIPGSVQKRRPFLIVSADAFNQNDRYAKVLVVHLTSRVSGTDFSWEVKLRKGTAGLRVSSIAKCNEVYTLFKDQLGELVGTLPAREMERVDEALRISLALG